MSIDIRSAVARFLGQSHGLGVPPGTGSPGIPQGYLWQSLPPTDIYLFGYIWKSQRQIKVWQNWRLSNSTGVSVTLGISYAGFYS